MKTKRIAELSLLTAIALIIFIIELRIPNIIPIQGVKLGLANIITVYAVYRFSAKEVAMLVVVRVLLGGVFSGNISALIYSFSGAVLCLVGMLLVKRIIPPEQLWLCSIIGAILHNTGQIIAAVAVTRSAAVIANYPFLIISGVISGLFTGICAQLVLKRVKRKGHRE